MSKEITIREILDIFDPDTLIHIRVRRKKIIDGKLEHFDDVIDQGLEARHFLDPIYSNIWPLKANSIALKNSNSPAGTPYIAMVSNLPELGEKEAE